ncbi:hypothetical protein B0H66DRAFT_594834 [Apodospora peruviana]|uniref:Berberine/berberine-like domain-containing protein n=1 Tax=Apodospora peruviana TaxID=516989 RepID=A0AAE0M0V7_9PEZI|nr:hypothetical protein B0H66DRAFT_594834 [Apodospora peruviana]
MRRGDGAMAECKLDVAYQSHLARNVVLTHVPKANQATYPMLPLWSNSTCVPNTVTSQPGAPAGCPDACSIGFLSAYAILPTTTDDVVAGVNVLQRKHEPGPFWALKGGGIGTFGVVTSATQKTCPTIPVTGMSFSITDTGDRLWEGVRIWHTMSPIYTAAGILTRAEFNAVVNPLLTKLRAVNVSFTATEPKTFPKFGDLYQSIWVNDFHGSGGGTYFGGRIAPQQDAKERGDEIFAAFCKMNDKYPGQVLFGGHLVNPRNRVKDRDQKLSVVHPVWRETADIQIFLYIPPPCMSAEQRADAERRVTFELGGILRAATPTSAVYSNEGDISEPSWQDALWGPFSYPKVLEIKKYDPDYVFWSKSSTGSEGWALRDNLKLCKTGVENLAEVPVELFCGLLTFALLKDWCCTNGRGEQPAYPVSLPTRGSRGLTEPATPILPNPPVTASEPSFRNINLTEITTLVVECSQ